MKTKRKREYPVVVHAGIVIREIKPGKWQTDLFRDGKRDRRVHESIGVAKRYAEGLAVKLRNEGSSALDLSQEQRRDALKALETLGGKATLAAAAQFWMKHNGLGDGVTVRELAQRWIADLRRRGCRLTTIAERTQKCNRLCADMGNRAACTISKDDILGWLDAWKITGATADGYRRCFNALFNFAAEEKIVEANVVSAIKRFRGDERLPTPFTVDAVRSLMAAAQQYHAVMVPTLAVQFFAGLRPGEAMGLKWEDINWTDKTIRVLPETSKMRRSRHVPINPTLLAWLTPHRKASGPIGITKQCTLSYYLDRARCDDVKGLLAAARVSWIKDGPRKTYASMHYATHSDAAKLAAILGHTGGHDVLFRHYRGLVKKTQAARYWKIRPATQGVIQFPKAVNQ